MEGVYSTTPYHTRIAAFIVWLMGYVSEIPSTCELEDVQGSPSEYMSFGYIMKCGFGTFFKKSVCACVHGEAIPVPGNNVS